MQDEEHTYIITNTYSDAYIAILYMCSIEIILETGTRKERKRYGYEIISSSSSSSANILYKVYKISIVLHRNVYSVHFVCTHYGRKMLAVLGVFKNFYSIFIQFLFIGHNNPLPDHKGFWDNLDQSYLHEIINVHLT